MLKQWRYLAAAILVVAAPASAWAARGYATSTVHMRAGPATEYPVVDTIPDNARVNIHGCLNARDWCDVTFSGNRGWVTATYLNYFYNNHYVYLPDYFDRIDVPVVTFALGSYWDNYYTGRPFYRRRAHFVNVFRSHRGGDHQRHVGRPHRGGHHAAAPHRRQRAIGHRAHNRAAGHRRQVGGGHRAAGLNAIRHHQRGAGLGRRAIGRHFGGNRGGAHLGGHRGGGRVHAGGGHQGGGGGHARVGGGHRGGGGGHRGHR